LGKGEIDCSGLCDRNRFGILIPDSYIGSATERLQLYSALDNIPDEDGLDKFSSSLKDRFGQYPDPGSAIN